MDLYEITRTATTKGEHATLVDYVVASGLVQAIQLHASRFTFDGKVLGVRLLESEIVIEEPSEPLDVVSQTGFRTEEDEEE